MAASHQTQLTARCACGKVEMRAIGAPVARAICYCDDCQAAGRQIEALPGAQPVLDADGGSNFIVYRKDRYSCTQGAEHLQNHKLKDASPTKRVVAACCNSAMYIGFDDAKHWVSAYRARFEAGPGPVQVRMCTKFKPEGVTLPADVPNHAGYPPGFLFKLLGARVAMLFGA